MPTTTRGLGTLDPWNTLQPARILFGDNGPSRDDVLDTLQLRHAQGRLKLGKPVIETCVFKPRDSVALHCAVVAQPPEAVREDVIVRHQHASLAGRDRLSRMKAEASDGPDGAALPTEIIGAECAR